MPTSTPTATPTGTTTTATATSTATATPTVVVATNFDVYIPLVIKDIPTLPVSNLRMSDTSYGPPVTQFPAGTTVVYLLFDYFGMQDDEVRAVVYDQVGSILFEQVEAYTGFGTESIEVAGPEGEAFAEGWYVTSVYSDSSLFPLETVLWYVGSS